MGLKSRDEAVARGYIFKNNPAISLFGDMGFTLNLAVNTAQYGRTFQDRWIGIDLKIMSQRISDSFHILL